MVRPAMNASISDASASLHAEIHPLLIRRIRIGAALVAVSIALYGGLELWQRRAPFVPFALVKLVQVATLVVVWRALDPARSWRRSVALALVLVAEVCVTLAISGVLTGEAASAPLLCVLVTLGTATLLPWGLGPQTIAVAVAGASLLLNALWAPVPDGFGYTAAAASMACLASLSVARELAEQRLRRRQAEEEERKSASALRDEIAIAETSAEAARELLAGGGVAHVLGTLCRLEARLVGCDATYTFLRDTHDAKTFAVVASHGDGGSSWTSRRALRIPDIVLARMIDRLARDQPLVVDGERDLLPVDGMVCVYTALMAGRDVAGIQVAVRRAARPFTPSDVELARRLTHTASAALAEARSVEARDRGIPQPVVGERVWRELQTPIGSMLRLAEHAADPNVPTAERRALATRIASTARDVLQMLEQLDRASKPSAGRTARG